MGLVRASNEHTWQALQLLAFKQQLHKEEPGLPEDTDHPRDWGTASTWTRDTYIYSEWPRKWWEHVKDTWEMVRCWGGGAPTVLVLRIQASSVGLHKPSFRTLKLDTGASERKIAGTTSGKSPCWQKRKGQPRRMKHERNVFTVDVTEIPIP